MRQTYDAHAVLLDCAFENAHEQPTMMNQVLNNEKNAQVNLDIDAVVPEPADDARNA